VLGAEGPAAAALFQTSAADGGPAWLAGQRRGSVLGSFVHLIDGEGG